MFLKVLKNNGILKKNFTHLEILQKLKCCFKIAYFKIIKAMFHRLAALLNKIGCISYQILFFNAFHASQKYTIKMKVSHLE